MLMKLARLDNEKIEPDIIQCCELNKAYYVPIIKNRFGILTDDLSMVHGADNNLDEPNTNLKVFVNIYKCATDIVKKRKFLFWKGNSYSPYNGKILDNLFFKRVIAFCIQNNIFISQVNIISEYNTEKEITDSEDIRELVTLKRGFIIEKMVIEFKNKSIIFDKVGYVDIASNLEFYRSNENIILKMLLVGFGE